MNKLQCPLCKQMFNEPCMCPHCSEVYCKKCIKGYLEEFYFCPNCDRHIIDLVDCSRLINQVKEKLKQSGMKKAKQSAVNTHQQCNQHSLPLKYHCLSCLIDICSDCGLISQKHKGHNIKPIESIKPPKKTIRLQVLKQLKHRIGQRLLWQQQQQKRYMLEIQLLKSQIKYNKAKIYEYYEDLISRLQRESQILFKQIQSRIHESTKHINQKLAIKQKIDQLERNYLTNTMDQCYSPLVEHMNIVRERDDQKLRTDHNYIQLTDRQLYKYLTEKNYLRPKKYLTNQKTNQKQQKQHQISNRNSQTHKSQLQLPYDQSILIEHQVISQLNGSNNSLLSDKKIYESIIMKEIYPDYHNFSFQLDYLISKDQDVVYSPTYKVYGYEWRLKIYPRGNAQAHNQHLSLFLELINSPQALTSNTPKQYYFRLQLLNLNQAGKSVIKQYNSKFSVSQCWGYAEFVELKQIKQYLHDGKLLFVMGVKNVSYYDQCDNMKKYIGKLQGEVKVLQEVCGNYYLANNDRGQDDSREESVEENLNGSINRRVNELLRLNQQVDSLGEQQQIIIGSSSRIDIPSNRQFINEDQISSIISSFDGD